MLYNVNLNYDRIDRLALTHKQKKIAPNTYLTKTPWFDHIGRQYECAYILRLYHSKVIVFTPTITYYNTDGYHTVTTRRRLMMGPHPIITKNGAWHIAGRKFYDWIAIGDPLMEDVEFENMYRLAAQGDYLAKLACRDYMEAAC